MIFDILFVILNRKSQSANEKLLPAPGLVTLSSVLPNLFLFNKPKQSVIHHVWDGGHSGN